jgi:hypothetical protein
MPQYRFSWTLASGETYTRTFNHPAPEPPYSSVVSFGLNAGGPATLFGRLRRALDHSARTLGSEPYGYARHGE